MASRIIQVSLRPAVLTGALALVALVLAACGGGANGVKY